MGADPSRRSPPNERTEKMPEHFTKNTVEASFWCNKCHKATVHRIDNGRRGPCKVCMAKLDEDAKKVPAARPAEQTEMF